MTFLHVSLTRNEPPFTNPQGQSDSKSAIVNHILQDLWKHKKWKYFINLTGQEFPLRTNWELVQILKAHNNGNMISVIRWDRYTGYMYLGYRQWQYTIENTFIGTRLLPTVLHMRVLSLLFLLPGWIKRESVIETPSDINQTSGQKSTKSRRFLTTSPGQKATCT